MNGLNPLGRALFELAARLAEQDVAGDVVLRLPEDAGGRALYQRLRDDVRARCALLGTEPAAGLDWELVFECPGLRIILMRP